MKIIVERIAVKEMIKFIADRKLSKDFLFLLHLGSLSFSFFFVFLYLCSLENDTELD